MSHDRSGGEEPPDERAETPDRPYRTDWQNIPERRRERARHEAAGASRDLASVLLAGGRA